MSTPYLKYYLIKNPNYKEEFNPMTEEEFLEQQSYEPSKSNLSYKEYLKRAKKGHERSSELPFALEKSAIDPDDEEECMARCENQDDFVRWVE